MAVLNALNGRLPDSLLTGLPWLEAAGFRLRADAAASAGRLATAFRAHFAAPLLLTDAYRTLAVQVTLKASKGVWAAAPGTSNHGLGIAIDFASGINVDGSPQHLWMTANAGRFGWVNPAWAINWNPADGQHEPWHWEYHPELDTTPAIHIDITPTPTPQEPDMTPDQAASLARIENYLAVPGQPFGWPQAISNKLDALTKAAANLTTALAVPGQPFTYPAATHNAVGEVLARVAALQAALAAGPSADLATITAAAEAGASAALANLHVTITG